MDTCFECDTQNNYYVESNGQCALCTMEGCLTCSAGGTCASCDEANQYFTN